MPLRFDKPVTMCPTGSQGNAVTHDRCAGRNGWDEGGVEPRSKSKPPLQEFLPACRSSTSQPRKGNEPSCSARHSRRQRPIRRLRSRRRRRDTARDRRSRNEHARAKCRPRAGFRRESLKRRPCSGGQLIVGRRDHAGGDRLL